MSAVCIHPWADMWVNAKGRMTCCPQNHTALGTLPADSPAKAWHGPAAQQVRRLVAAGRYEEAGCERECPFLRNSSTPPDDEPPQAEMINQPFTPPVDADSAYAQNLAGVQAAFARREADIDTLPLFVDLQPVILCNAACIMCGQPHADPTRHTPEIRAALDSLKPTASHFRWQGGEVFTDPHFAAYLESFGADDAPQPGRCVITNGTLITRAIAERLLRPPHPVHFLVSIDGATAPTFEKIRHHLRFDRAWAGLVHLATRQREIGVTDRVIWNYVVMKSTWPEMRQAMQMAAELQVAINFAPLQRPCGDENLFLDPAVMPGLDLMCELDDLERFAANLPIPVSGFTGMRYRLRQVMPPPAPVGAP